MIILAKFHSGESAKVENVEVEFNSHFLNFDNGLKRYSWGYAELKVESFGSDEYIIRYGKSNLCISLSDWEKVKDKFPQKPLSFNIPIYGYIILIASLIGFYYLFIPIASHIIADLIPESATDSLGEDVLASLPIDNDCSSRLRKKYIEDLLYELHLSEDYKIVFVSKSSPNAFAVPGKLIIFTTGAVKAFKNENELVGVLAHEIQHHVQRHHVRRIVKMGFTSVLWNVTVSSLTGYMAFDPEIIKAFLERNYDAQDEREADIEAVAMLKQRDISGKGLISFLDSYKEKTLMIKNIERLISTHPAIVDRIEYLEELTQEDGKRKILLSKKRWDEFKMGCPDNIDFFEDVKKMRDQEI